jgi:hypothetical protein
MQRLTVRQFCQAVFNVVGLLGLIVEQKQFHSLWDRKFNCIFCDEQALALQSWNGTSIASFPDMSLSQWKIDNVLDGKRKMSVLPNLSTATSNDLLFRLAPEYPRVAANYKVVAQSISDIRDIQNAPAVSMEPYLLKTGQIRLLTTISVYSLPGKSAEQARLLYMNATAFHIWEEMGKSPNVIGSQFRPAHAALLAFGVPFSE